MTIFYVFSIDYQLISHRKAVVQEAISRGYEVSVVAANTGYRKEIENMGVRFIELPINRVGTNPIEELKTLRFLCRLYRKEKPDIVNAVGAHHDEMEMTTMIAPIVQVCDAISGARPGARREIVEAYIKRLNDLENIAMSYPGVTKTYAIQAGRELRVIVGADKIDDVQTEKLSGEIAKKIQDEMTYPGQVKITVIRETRSVSYAK